mgnify:CR=1 FL=1
MILLSLLSKINQHIYESKVISLTDVGNIGRKIKKLGVSVHALGMNPGKPSLSCFIRLMKMIRKQNPDLVHTWLPHSALLGGLAAKIVNRKIPVIWGIFQSNLDRDKNKWHTLFTIKMCALLSWAIPRQIVTDSDMAAIVHQQAGFDSEKFVVIPNGFDTDQYRPDYFERESVRKEIDVPIGTLLVGLIARFDLLKNHKGFIEAIGLLDHKFHNVHFILVGSGIDNENHDLKYWIQQTRNEKAFHLLGERKDIPRLMAALDLMVSSSHGESFPLVIGEAMACGVPCVVTDVGDTARVVGNTGRVVPPDDSKSLAVALEEMLSLTDEERRKLGALARLRVEKKFSIRQKVQLYKKLHTKIARGS